MTWQQWAGYALVGLSWAVTVIAVALWWRERGGYAHTCRMIPTAVSPAAQVGAYNTLAGVRPTSTAILWRCAYCTEVDASTVPGSWTVDDVLAWGTGPMPPGWGDYEDDSQGGLDADGDPIALIDEAARLDPEVTAAGSVDAGMHHTWTADTPENTQ